VRKYFSLALLLGIVAAIFCTTSLSANIIWPALFISQSILSSWFLIIVSIVIEGLFFKICIKDIPYKSAMILSLIGNTASTIVGVAIMPMAMLGWHLVFDFILGSAFNPVNIIASYIIMFTGSCFVEFFALKIWFKYQKKELLMPILIGNFTTYVLAALYQFSHEITKILGF